MKLLIPASSRQRVGIMNHFTAYVEQFAKGVRLLNEDVFYLYVENSV